MTKLQNILFHLDFSPESADAAEYVKRRAMQFGAGITVLHVADPKHFVLHGGDLSLRPIQEVEADVVAAHGRQFHELVDKLFGKGKVRRIMSVGDEAETIMSVAEQESCDVIMLPTRRQNLLSAALEESLLARVMEMANTPVWTIDSAYSLSPYLPYSSTLCALDFHPDGSLNDQNRRIVESAKLISQTLQTKVILLHVITETDMQERGEFSGIRLNIWLEEQLSGIRREVGDQATYVLEQGDVPSVINQVANKAGAGITIAGRSHSYSLSGRAQSTVLHLVRSSPCPVLSLR